MKPYKKKNYSEIKLGSGEYSKNHRAKLIYDVDSGGNKAYMFETSLAVMINYVEKGGIGILSAFRGDCDLKGNLHRHDMMKQRFKKNGVKMIEVVGCWLENSGTSRERHATELSLAVPFFEKDWLGSLHESSIPVKESVNYRDLSIVENKEMSKINVSSASDLRPFNKFSHFLLKVAGIFNRDAVVIANQEEGVYLHYRTGKKEKIGCTAAIDEIGRAYAKLRSGRDEERTFVFEGTRSPVNFIDAHNLVHEGILY